MELRNSVIISELSYDFRKYENNFGLRKYVNT